MDCNIKNYITVILEINQEFFLNQFSAQLCQKTLPACFRCVFGPSLVASFNMLRLRLCYVLIQRIDELISFKGTGAYVFIPKRGIILKWTLLITC